MMMDWGVAPRRSDHTHRATSTMTCDKDFNPMAKRIHTQVMESKKSKETKKTQNKEEMIAHNRAMALTA